MIRPDRSGEDAPPDTGITRPFSGRSGADGLEPSRSDSRVTTALERYLGEVEAGRTPDRDTFLAEYPEIAGELADCLGGLDLVRSAADDLADAGRHEAPFPTATVLGDFEILREIGRGGMGVVYEAEQRSLGRRVALKVLPFAASLDPRQRQRFQVEAQAAALLHHTHIVPVYAVGSDRGVPFYAMQFIDGRSLAAVIDELRARPRPEHAETLDVGGAGPLSRDGDPSGGPPPSREATPSPSSSGSKSGRRSSSRGRSGTREQHRAAARLGLQAAEALAHAHALGVVHRDIKPGNLLVDASGALWVTDFGLARIQDAVGPTRTGDLVGTVRYMSPEQAGVIGDAVDHRSDLYALGATLYELLTLRPPFDGRDRRTLLRQIAMEEPTAPRRIDPTIPKDLETIVLKALSKDPRDRYADAVGLADDLHRFLDDRAILARRPNPIERVARWGRRHRPLVATATIILVACLGIGLVVLGEERAALKDALDSKAEALKEKEQALGEAQAARREASEALFLSYGLMQAVTVEAMGTLAVNDLMSPEMYDRARGYFDRISRLETRDPTLLGLRADAARWAGYFGATRQYLLVSRDLAERGWDPDIAADYRRSIDLNRRLIASSADPEFVTNLAVALDSYAWWLGWADPSRSAEVEGARTESMDLWRRLATSDDGDQADLNNWIGAVMRKEERLVRDGRPAEAEALRSECLATLDGLAESDPGRRPLAAAGYLKFGDEEVARGNYEIGFDLHRAAIRLDPDSPRVLNNLAWALVNAPDRTPEQLEEALALSRRAVQMAPKDGLIVNTLAVALYRAGDLDAAEATISESIRLNEGEVPIDHFLLAMIHHRRGNPDEARRQFKSAQSLIEARGIGATDPETDRFRDEAATLLELEDNPGRPKDDGPPPDAP